MAESPSELQTEIEKLERKHTENPEGRYFVPLANAYRKMGEAEHAEHLLRAGLKYHPDYLSAHIVLGRCLADQHQLEAAEEEFRHVLSVDSQNLVALRSLGEVAQAAGRPDEAERWYRKLLEVDPMNDDARRALEDEDEGDTSGGDMYDFESTEVSDEASATPMGFERHSDFEQPMELDEVLDLSGTEPGAEHADEGHELVTETIADLYARQGFHDRAAAVYRELIRRNGSTPSLEERLSAVERQAAAGNEPEPVQPEPASADAIDSDDSFADSFAIGFGGETEPPGEIAGYEDVQRTESVGIQDYLRDLVAWKPGSLANEQPTEEFEPISGLEPTTGDDLEGEELQYLPEEPLPWETSAQSVSDDPFAEDLPEPEPRHQPEPEPEPQQPAAEADATAEDEDDLESFQAWLRSLKR